MTHIRNDLAFTYVELNVQVTMLNMGLFITNNTFTKFVILKLYLSSLMICVISIMVVRSSLLSVYHGI